MMRWLALHFGKEIEWNGPTIFGVGYAWCGRIWFTERGKRMDPMQRRVVIWAAIAFGIAFAFIMLALVTWIIVIEIGWIGN